MASEAPRGQLATAPIPTPTARPLTVPVNAPAVHPSSWWDTDYAQRQRGNVRPQEAPHDAPGTQRLFTATQAVGSAAAQLGSQANSPVPSHHSLHL